MKISHCCNHTHTFSLLKLCVREDELSQCERREKTEALLANRKDSYRPYNGVYLVSILFLRHPAASLTFA